MQVCCDMEEKAVVSLKEHCRKYVVICVVQMYLQGQFVKLAAD